MLRKTENSVSFKAGMLAVGVHAGLLIALFLSVNWQTTHTVSVAEVELWDSLPTQSMPPLAKPDVEPEPKAQPEPVIEKPTEPQPAPKAEIVIKEKEKPKLVEKQKPDALSALKKELMLEEQEKEKRAQAEKRTSDLAKLQQELLGENNQQNTAKSSASAGEINQYKAQIQRKIRQKVNNSLCGDGNPELTFEIALSPDGMLQGNPRLVKSSNISACDDAVDRAILQSQPLPLPADVSLRSQFRNLTLKFRPNSE